MERATARSVRLGGLLAAMLGVAWLGYLAADEPQAGTKFIGAGKCRLCHMSRRSGDQFSTWQKMEHSKAYATLGQDRAREIARARGIDDPLQSEKCLQCHVTAFGVPASGRGMKFDPEMGVQCESCHGAGMRHFKARLAAAGKDDVYDITEEPYVKIPPGEIDIEPTYDTCLKCHNEESPTFKPLCTEKIAREIMHFFRRVPTAEEVAKLKKKVTEVLGAKKVSCGGPATCETCRKASSP